MRNRVAQGELLLALFFAVLGALWIVAALRMPLWAGFVPQSGFMPLWYGVILAALAAAIFLGVLLKGEARAGEPVGKALVVLAALAAGIAGLGPIGFAPAVFLMLLVLFAAVERLPLVRSLLVALATTAVLYLVFKTWLGVALPRGPLGF